MLVSNQTTVGGGSRVMRELISSCYEAQEHFRSAAARSEDLTLKRLFEIYAQQRTRFAEELREHLPVVDGDEAQGADGGDPEEGTSGDLLADCLSSDSRTLRLYKEALASRDLPTRTHFLIAAQLALLERAHDRVSSLVQRPAPPNRSVLANSARARA